ncbi:MAG TPA: DUF1285 domain-containing protein [Spirochaetota bacterium]|nr:DUF1285 domain-containing protein [Spirochaetota bacterium]HPJ33799.1 DUF1285 domain-containing protein [Spirochaetota bacterium]
MDNTYPEIPDYIKEMILSGEIDDIFLDKEGRWFHNGEPFLNEKITAFFSKSVDITTDGQYVIHYSDFTYPIRVEDTPIFVTGVRFDGFGSFERIFINTSDGETEELDIYTIYYGNNNALYCRVRHGRMPARFMRSPSFYILERLEEKSDGCYSLRLCGQIIDLKTEEKKSEKVL